MCQSRPQPRHELSMIAARRLAEEPHQAMNGISQLLLPGELKISLPRLMIK
jgi:hypothetical protein